MSATEDSRVTVRAVAIQERVNTPCAAEGSNRAKPHAWYPMRRDGLLESLEWRSCLFCGREMWVQLVDCELRL